MESGDTNAGKQRIAVAMSGGVDSSVAAALLRDQGYAVTGVFIITWTAPWLPCTWKEERLDAMRAATQLGIPFETVDLSATYEREVVDYMVREYREGRTPNPDVMCNKEVKFGAFLTWARDQGFDAIATGHYARIASHESQVTSHECTSAGTATRDVSTRPLANPPTRPRLYSLPTGIDVAKDQSYFLWTLTQDQLAQVYFPVGHLEKSAVRAIAEQYGLHTATKKDSQGVCFLGKIDMKEFLQHYIDAVPGEVLTQEGITIGTHDGAVLYTLGERHGFTTQKQSPHDPPLYIVVKDIVANTLTVAPKRDTTPEPLVRQLAYVNWIPPYVPGEEIACEVRYRYRGERVRATLALEGGERATVTFTETPAYLASGQSVVAYSGEECLGGGVLT